MTHKYTVYFRVFGKALKATVEAETSEQAAKKILEGFEIDKIVKRKPKTIDDIIQDFKDIIG